jgi:hypothetical protein
MFFFETGDAGACSAGGTSGYGAFYLVWGDEFVAGEGGAVFWFRGGEFEDHEVVFCDEGLG